MCGYLCKYTMHTCMYTDELCFMTTHQWITLSLDNK